MSTVQRDTGRPVPSVNRTARAPGSSPCALSKVGGRGRVGAAGHRGGGDRVSSQSGIENDEATLVFEGRDGLERLKGLGTLSAPDPDRFAGRLDRVRLDSIVVEGFSTTPLHLTRTIDDAERTDPLVVIVAVREGSLSITEERGHMHLTAGDAIAIHSEIPLEAEATESVTAVEAAIRYERLPAYLRDGPPMPVGLLKKTLLLDSYTGFLNSVVTHREPIPAEHDHLIAALQELTFSVLAEARGASMPRVGAEGLRLRIKEYIIRNSADPDLNPAMIAAALDVSIRNVHHVFRDESESVSSFIREQRLNSVAVMLNGSLKDTRVAELALRSGFAGPDQLTRAFRRRYGVTIEEYRENSELFRL